ncbi:MAG: transglycosylase domain-containing protein [Acidaminococcaceae bacterium]
MKKIGFILIFLLIFLFFPFPKNIGPQYKPDLKSVTTSVETTVKKSEFSPLSLLPAPSSWPKPLYMVWQAAHIKQAVQEKVTKDYWIEIAKIPPTLLQAVVAIEDHRFYEHSGVDIDGIFRALLANIQADEIVQGGSTITQQLVKNTLLSSTQSVERKTLEIFLALISEASYSKDDILEMYLNSAYFGAGAYGVTQAANVYFAKTPEELTLAESATLAGLLNAPSALNPYQNPEDCKSRRNLVLKTMAKRGMITGTLATNTSNEPIVLREK